MTRDTPTAVAIRWLHAGEYVYYHTYAEGGDGFGPLGPLTRLWPDEPEWASAWRKRDELQKSIDFTTVEVVRVNLSLADTNEVLR